MAEAIAMRDMLTIRIPCEIRDLLDRAAASRGERLAEFIMEAAQRAAEEALLGRTVITVDTEVYVAFQAWLDAPRQPNERLRRTMQTSAPWDEALQSR